MPMRPIALVMLVLSAGTALAFGEPRFEITSRLTGYDLAQGTGKSSTSTDLPPITVPSGSEGLIKLGQEIKYAKGSDNKWIPLLGPVTVTHNRTAFLGIRCPIYVRQADEEGKVTFLLRAEICERDIANEELSPVIKTTSSVRGVATVGKTKTITIGAPGGKKATLEITFTLK
jgi:hypothetical protein